MKSVPLFYSPRYLRAFALAILLLFALDAALFRTPWYRSILHPDSSTGIYEMTLTRELGVQRSAGDNLVLTVGDSRFAYSMRLADQAGTGYVYRHGGVAGTNAREWYYLLRDLDPTAARYRAIVFGVPGYEDEDEAFNPNDDIRALHYSLMRIQPADIREFVLSFDDPQLRWEALRGVLLRGFVLQNDLHSLLSHPRQRLDYTALCNRDWPSWTYTFEETTHSMAGLTIDWNSLTATFPAGCTDDQRATVENALLRRPYPQIGREAAFRRLWFSRIFERYGHSRTRIIFIRLPRGAIPRPASLVPTRSASIREFAAKPGVWLVPENTFDALESPELFKDGIHLNRAGIARFSPMLAKEIASLLGSPDAL